MATSRRTGNYSTSARAVVQASDQIFNAAMEGKPDFTKIAQEAIKGRSKERQAATVAEARVAKAGLDAFTDVKKTKINIDSEKAVNDALRPAKRMAGIVGGLGAIAGGYVMLEGNKRDKAERDELLAYRNELDAKQDLRDAEWEKRNQAYIDYLNNRGNGGSDSSDPKPSTPASRKTSAPLSVNANPISSAEAPGAKDYSGSTLSQAKITSIAEQVGFSPENARIMGAIAMGESGGKVGIDTVQSGLDPNRSNEYSIGLTQINTQAHMDKLKRRGYTVEDMRDPIKNLTIAKEVFDEVGSFKPWSVYKHNKHLPYLK